MHVEGKRASDRVRSGEEVEMKTREVCVHRFDLLSYEDGLLAADIHVSKGTYIRSLPRSAAQRAAPLHLESHRTAIGPYRLEEAQSASSGEALDTSLERSEEYLLRLPGMGRVTCSPGELERMVHGQYPPSARSAGRSGWAMAYDMDGSLRAVLDLERRKIACWVRPSGGKEESVEAL